MYKKNHFPQAPAQQENAENFSLNEFIPTYNTTLYDKVIPFSKYYRENLVSGKALYAREIIGPCKHRSMVKDEKTNTIQEMIMLGSNNYLGLTTHPQVCCDVIAAVQKYGVGMGGPPLLNGMSQLHRELEQRLAQLKGGLQYEQYDAMLFGSGFQANLGWIKGMLSKGDILLYDELNHASLYDGISQLNHESKIKALRFKHNNCEQLKTLLEKYAQKGKNQTYVAIEGVYSMDGDLAPMKEISLLCEHYGAALVVDDAHGSGVMGPCGGGTAEHFGLNGKIDISIGTFSKTFGVTGGFIVAKKEIIDYLRFFARSYMFSAHLPPPTVAAVISGLNVIRDEPHLRKQLFTNASYLSTELNKIGLLIKHEAAILPIFISPEIDIRQLNRRIHEEGVFLNSIEYPAVPLHKQRLRLSVMATHTKDDLDYVVQVFKKIKQEFNI